MDSIEFLGGYEHNVQGTTDSVIFEMVTGYQAPVLVDALDDETTQSIYGVDTLKFYDIRFNPMTEMIDTAKLDSN